MNTINIKPWYQRPCPAAAPNGLNDRLEHTIEVLNDATRHAPSVLAHSLSAEDMVLFHLIAMHNFPIDAIALDTERLHASAHALWKQAEEKYGRQIQAVKPDVERIATLVKANADSEIYNDKTIRELCCNVRKTEPLRRALKGKKSWVTGLRRAQSAGRAQVPHYEFDTAFGLEKFNPLADWSDDDLWYLIDLMQIPVSTLYDKGYASIGCDPCTRPIREDEHPRAGRWWWEQGANKTASECGIHIAAPLMSNANNANKLNKEIA
jgi:phosphoadenosine phosphosulfate reductase